MKAIHKLSVRKKAILLQQLFPLEFSEFLTYLKTVAVETKDDSEELTRVWGNQILAVGYWLTLAQFTLFKMEEYQISELDTFFADRLFRGKSYLFTMYHLSQFTKQEDSSEKFVMAVNLFFDTGQFGQI